MYKEVQNRNNQETPIQVRTQIALARPKIFKLLQSNCGAIMIY